MSGNTFGKMFRVTSYGESHGPAIGCIVDGCPPGLELAPTDIQPLLDLRKPGSSQMVTQRRETDQIKILSGVFAGKTTGTPIALQIDNIDAKEKDYSQNKDKFRPGHGEFVYHAKYGHYDYRGGGRASARETVVRVAAGAIAKKFLADNLGVKFYAYVKQIGEISAEVKAVGDELTMQTYDNPFYFPDQSQHAKLEELINNLRKEGNSIGALVELAINKVPAGLGAPVFAKLDAMLAQAMMSINAVKAVEIGDGFACVTTKGSEFRDEILPNGFASNHAGGILAGISTGQDIKLRVGFKPPSSIRIPAATIDKDHNPTTIEVKGRHDPCVGIRAVPIVEAMAALVIMDAFIINRGQNGVL